jgi:hypothetical protein
MRLCSEEDRSTGKRMGPQREPLSPPGTGPACRCRPLATSRLGASRSQSEVQRSRWRQVSDWPRCFGEKATPGHVRRERMAGHDHLLLRRRYLARTRLRRQLSYLRWR